MGGGGTTTSQGTIDPTLQPLYRGSANQLLQYQQQNPLTGYAQPNVRGTVGLSPYESAGLMAMGNLFNASPFEALAAQSIMAAPGVARQGPTTGSYGYGGLQDMQSIYGMLGGGNPLQQRVLPGGGAGYPGGGAGGGGNNPALPRPPQPPPTGGGGPGGPSGGPAGPPIAYSQVSDDFALNDFGGFPEMSSQVEPPPPQQGGQPGIQGFRRHSFASPEEAQAWLDRSGITQGFQEMQASRRASQAARGLQNNANTQLSNQVYEQGPSIVSDGMGGYRIHTDQGTHNWSGPRLMEAMEQFGDAETKAQVAQYRANPGMFASTRPGFQQAAPVMSAEQAARQNAAQSAGFQYGAHTPSAMPGGSATAAPTTSGATGNAAGGGAPAPAPAGINATAEQARLLRQARAAAPVTVARR